MLERLLEGDRLALVELSRLINSFLSRWNAYDFRDEWDDLIQEVLVASGTALREGRIRERAAVVGYLRTTARFKFVDRLKSHLRHRENDTLPWEDVVDSSLEPASDDEAADATRRDLQRALAKLPEKKREAVLAVYVHGKTYDEASDATGIPLGSLKRYLREGLSELRLELSPLLEGL